MIKEIINILVNDAQLTSLNGANNIYPLYLITDSSNNGQGIIYNHHTFSANKITEQHRVEFKIIQSSYSKALQIEERLKYLLLTFGDNPLTNNILQAELNGGGTLFDDDRQKYHIILYFDFISRSENK